MDEEMENGVDEARKLKKKKRWPWQRKRRRLWRKRRFEKMEKMVNI